MMRFCPSCLTERDVSELFCAGEVDGQPCVWDLSGEALRPEGWRPPAPRAVPVSLVEFETPSCRNGHTLDAGDLLCPVCGADIDEHGSVPPAEPISTPGPLSRTDPVEEATVIAGWRLNSRVSSASVVGERFTVTRADDRREALLTLYSEGSEPDLEVYDVLRSLDREHVPEIIETGRWLDRAYEVAEDLRCGTLADLGLLPDDLSTLRTVVTEIGGALAAFAECGLRHRDLRPGVIMVRTRDPLDLVVTGFGSARLSDFDLDIVSPLETTRYTAPEAVAGGVAAASDWWSLGMLLLEQVTRGKGFEGVDDQVFLIHVLTNGAPIPDGLKPDVDLLLRGLLARDRRERWGWPEAQRWLAGDPPPAPTSSRAPGDISGRRSIVLADKPYSSLTAFALAAADLEAWDEARDLLLRGGLVTWMEDAGFDAALRAEIRRTAALDDVSEK